MELGNSQIKSFII